MIKVIRKGMLRRITCSRCNSLLEYDEIMDPYCNDIRYDSNLKASVYTWYINCPECNHKIMVEERVSGGKQE